MNVRNFMKKLILVLGILGISITSFAVTRRHNRIVYVKREPRRIIRRYIFIRVPRRKKTVYVKREPSRRQRRARIAAGRRRAARRR